MAGRLPHHFPEEEFNGTWVGAGVRTGPWDEEGTDFKVVPVARGGSDTTGTGLIRSDTIGLDRLITVEDSQPQAPESIPTHG